MDSPRRKIIPKRALVGLLCVVSIFIIIMIFALSPVFVLKNVKIHGNYYLPDDEVRRISGIAMGENIFQMKVEDIIQTMSKDIRVERAQVKRVLPDTIDILVVERAPLAIIKCNYGYLEAGQGGIILAAHRNLTNIPVPIVSGFTVSDLFVGDRLEYENINHVLAYLDQLEWETSTSISEINIADPDNVMVYMKGGVQMRMGNIGSLEKKRDITESVSHEIRQGKHPVDYVDARFDGSYSIKLKQ